MDRAQAVDEDFEGDVKAGREAIGPPSGRSEDFDVYLEEIRANHRLKRNLMKLMAELDPASPSRLSG